MRLAASSNARKKCRDTRRVSWLIDGVRDLRHGVRLLARSPMFAAAAILSLGIGIGANVSMFSIVDALLLKKLPVSESRRPRALHRDRRASVPLERTAVRALRTAARSIAIVLGDGAVSAGRTSESSSVDNPANDSGVERDDARGVDHRQLFFDARHHRGDGPHHRSRRQHRSAGRRRQRCILAGAPEGRSRPRRRTRSI